MQEQKERTLTRYPFSFFPLLEDEFWGLESTSSTGLSISEDRNNVYVEAHLPGLKTENIELSFEKGVLWIKGQKKEEEQDREKKYYRKAASSFSYHVQVPGQINEKKEPEATYKDGVLKVSFSKNVEPSARKIDIKSA